MRVALARLCGSEFAADPWKKEMVMEDLVFLALSVAFFAATFGMAFLFERLREQK